MEGISFLHMLRRIAGDRGSVVGKRAILSRDAAAQMVAADIVQLTFCLPPNPRGAERTFT